MADLPEELKRTSALAREEMRKFDRLSAQAANKLITLAEQAARDLALFKREIDANLDVILAQREELRARRENAAA